MEEKRRVNGELMALRNVSKRFGNVQALCGVDFSVCRGEVVGLVGDNGAGKSTLIKVLSGVYTPDSGELYFEGRPVRFTSPQQARALGIETVYQDLALVEEMSLWRNFFLGKELRTRLGPLAVLDVARMRALCSQALADMGIRLRSPDEPVGILSGGERQAVAIARAVHFGAKLLILDEPTAALSVKETARVLEAVEETKRRGLGVVLIMHNLAQVHPVADRIVVLERGIQIGSFRRGEITLGDLAALLARG